MWFYSLILLFFIPISNEPDTRSSANQFATTYNYWLSTLEEKKPDIINAKEVRAWQDVRKAWKILDRSIKY